MSEVRPKNKFFCQKSDLIRVNYTIDEQLKSQMIWTIYEDQNKNLLFAMAAGGVYKFNGLSFGKKF